MEIMDLVVEDQLPRSPTCSKFQLHVKGTMGGQTSAVGWRVEQQAEKNTVVSCYHDGQNDKMSLVIHFHFTNTCKELL